MVFDFSFPLVLACTMSMVQAAVTKTLNQKSDQQSQEKPKLSLKSILKHAKNNGSSWLHPVISWWWPQTVHVSPVLHAVT